MLIMTMGTEFWPRTLEGRLLCFLLALYGFAMFGYLTASLASFFVGRDAASGDGEVAGTDEIKALKDEITALRRTLGAPQDFRREGREDKDPAPMRDQSQRRGVAHRD